MNPDEFDNYFEDVGDDQLPAPTEVTEETHPNVGTNYFKDIYSATPTKPPEPVENADLIFNDIKDDLKPYPTEATDQTHPATTSFYSELNKPAATNTSNLVKPIDFTKDYNTTSSDAGFAPTYVGKDGKTYTKDSAYGGSITNNDGSKSYDRAGFPRGDDREKVAGVITPGEQADLLNAKKKNYNPKDLYRKVSGTTEQIFSNKGSLYPTSSLTIDGTQKFERRSAAHQFASQTPTEATPDSEWVSNAFLIPSVDIESNDDKYNRYWSSASLKFYDTSMGGNIAVNARPQFCWYSDIRDPGRLNRNEVTVTDYTADYGLGRYYSEAIDDPAQKVFITFGVPQFNSISNFVRRAFDSDQIILTKTGREKSAWYSVAKGITQAAWVVQFPIVGVWWFAASAFDFFFPSPQSKYYTLKNDMYHYWSIVDNLVNQVAINSGFVAKLPWEDAGKTDIQRIGRPYKMDEDHYKALNKANPDIVRNVGGVLRIDVYSMATKAQRMYNKMFLEDYNRANTQGTAYDYRGYVKKNNGSHQTYITAANGNPGLMARLANLVTSSYYSVDGAQGKMNKTEIHPMLKEGGLQNDVNFDKSTTDLNSEDPDLVVIDKPKTTTGTTGTGAGGTSAIGADGIPDQSNLGNKDNGKNADGETDISNMELTESAQSSLSPEKTMEGHKTDNSWWTKMKGELSALYNDGTRFAVFNVDHTGSVSSSFSNSYGESDLANKLNSTSSQIREARFSFADGNLLEGAGKVVQSVLGAAKDVVAGALDGLTFGFSNILKGLAGNGYLDIPKHWMSSQAQLPRMTYNIKLISPYGNTMSRLQNIYIPLCMILAGALPRATGKSSYGAPFICQVFDTGRFQSKLAAIESVSVTVGTSNLPFNTSGKPLAIDVSFTVIDLSSILYMPVSTGGILGNINVAMDEDNSLVDYLAVLAGQDIYSQIYPFPKARLNLIKAMNSWSAITSEAFQAAVIHDKSLHGGGLYWVTRPFAKVVEGMSKGTGATQSLDNR